MAGDRAHETDDLLKGPFVWNEPHSWRPEPKPEPSPDQVEWRRIKGTPPEAKRWEEVVGPDLQLAVALRRLGLTAAQAQGLDRPLELLKARQMPGTSVFQLFSSKDWKGLRALNRAHDRLAKAVRTGDSEAVKRCLGPLIDLALGVPIALGLHGPSSVSGGLAAIVRGSRYETAAIAREARWGDRTGWDPFGDYDTQAVVHDRPSMALLRNGAVLGVRSTDVSPDAPLERLGYWRGRYAAGSRWARWDLRPAEPDELMAFAVESGDVLAEMFIDGPTNRRMGDWTVPGARKKGTEPFWAFQGIVSHPAGDVLEERYGFDAVLAVTDEIISEDGWSRWTTLGTSPDEAYWDQTPVESRALASHFSEAGWSEVVRRMKGWPSAN